MIKRLALTALTFALALAFLAISLVNTSSVKFAFNTPPTNDENMAIKDINVDYELPIHLEAEPDTVFWTLNSLVDNMHASVTFDEMKKGEIFLSHADARLVAGERLFDEGKIAEGIIMLHKAEDYLIHAYKQAITDDDLNARKLLKEISLASLKHREILEKVLARSPEDAKPVVVLTLDKPKLVYRESRQVLEESGYSAPQNPFEKI